jgi:hypothetical protein
VFGSSTGPRYITTQNTIELKKGTYISIDSVCGEATGGSIQLSEDPDNNEDIIVEVSTDGELFVALPGRITEQNSSTSRYTTFSFQMPLDDNNYYIRLRQTDDSGAGYDYHAVKNLRYNLNTVLYDAETNTKIFI